MPNSHQIMRRNSMQSYSPAPLTRSEIEIGLLYSYKVSLFICYIMVACVAGLCQGNDNPGATNVTHLNAIRLADQFPGVDIGAKINAAIEDAGPGGGLIWVGSGLYKFSTQILLKNGTNLRC